MSASHTVSKVYIINKVFAFVSQQIIRRNTTSSSEATSVFHPPIRACYIRIILNQTNGSLWIRLELLGCKGQFQQDLIKCRKNS